MCTEQGLLVVNGPCCIEHGARADGSYGLFNVVNHAKRRTTAAHTPTAAAARSACSASWDTAWWLFEALLPSACLSILPIAKGGCLGGQTWCAVSSKLVCVHRSTFVPPPPLSI